MWGKPARERLRFVQGQELKALLGQHLMHPGAWGTSHQVRHEGRYA